MPCLYSARDLPGTCKVSIPNYCIALLRVTTPLAPSPAGDKPECTYII